MGEKFKYVVAFDLDRTILRVNSSRMIVKESRKAGLMKTRDYWQAVRYSVIYKFDLKDANEIVADMTSWLKGLEEDKVRGLINSRLIPNLIPLIRPEIRAEIKEHREKGACLLLLSSAMSYVCEPIAEHLEMHDIISSHLETRDGIFTGRPTGKLVFGKEKAVRMKEYCQDNGYPLESAWYYGDAFTDSFVMKETGYAVCVKPEIKLRALAKRKGWKII